MSSWGRGALVLAGGGTWRLRLVMATTMNASWAASARASTKVATWGARASTVARKSPPPPAPGFQKFAVISMMIRFALQHPQALVLSWQTDSTSCALVLPIDDPYKERQCPFPNPNALITGAR